MRKIDCHTHIINEKVRDAYFSRTDDIAIVMQFPQSILDNPDTVQTVKSDARLFLCPCVDLKRDIVPQLRNIEAHMDDWKVAGLKIYTSYQAGSADDGRLLPVYEFAERLGLTVVFHTGLCSLVLPSDQDLEGSSARYIAKAAEMFPGVNFVAAHMDDPNEQACCALCADHPNLFTDFSGLFEDGYEADWDVLKVRYGGAVRAAGCESQLLYGTDFCPPIGLTDIERFDAFFAELFTEKERETIYYDNALRAFPRLAEF
ncbi:MAG: amidohydrolase [Firmicutes bacterium]|nr:amidohydrolase [Bacillota bacterium]